MNLKINENGKVWIPKNYKKLSWNIFKNFNLQDCLVFMIWGFLAVVGWLVNVNSVVLNACLSVIFIGLGLMLNSKINNGEMKLYNLLFLFIKYIVSPKIINVKGKNNHIINYSKHLENKYILKVDTQYILNFKIYGNDIEIMNEAEQYNEINKLVEINKIFGNLNIRYTKISENVKLEQQREILNNLRDKYKDNKIVFEIFNKQIENLNELETQDTLKQNHICLSIYFTNEKQALSQMKEIQRLLNSKVENVMLNNVEAESLLNLNELKEIELIKNKVKSIETINKDGSKNEKAYFLLYQYPNEIGLFWLSELMRNPNINFCINIGNIDKYNAIKSLNNSLQKINLSSSFQVKLDEQTEQANYRNSVESLIGDITNETDILKEINIIISIDLDKEFEYSNGVEILKDIELSYNLKFTPLKFLQFTAFKSTLLGGTDYLNDKMGVPLPNNVFATSYFLSNLGLIDKEGSLIGCSKSNGNPLIFDIFNKTNIRTNNNMLILGTSGSGKSFLSKKILYQNVLKGNKVFIIDAEQEYKNMTNNLKGNYILFGDKRYSINPLQIFTSLKDDDEINNSFNEHMIFLQGFLEALDYKVSKFMINVILDIIRFTYAKFNIYETSNFEAIKNNEYPLFSDCYKEINNFFKAQESKKEYIFENDLKNNVRMILNDLANGKLAHLFNSHTALNLSSSLTTFNLKQILKAESTTILNVFVVLILKILEQEIFSNNKNNNKKKIIIMIDEAHLFMDKDNPLFLKFIFNGTKRIRKYNGSFIIATQNIKDLVNGNPLCEQYTQGIINNSQYLLYGKLKENDLKDLRDLYEGIGGINDEIINSISNAEQGDFYFKVSSNQQYLIEIWGLNLEKDLFEIDLYGK